MSRSIRVAVPYVLNSLIQMHDAVSLATSDRYCELIFKSTDSNVHSIIKIINVRNKNIKNEIRSFIDKVLSSDFMTAEAQDGCFELSVEMKCDSTKIGVNDKALIIAGIICGYNYFYKLGLSKQENTKKVIELSKQVGFEFNISTAIAALNGGVVSMISEAEGTFFKIGIPNGLYLNYFSLEGEPIKQICTNSDLTLAWGGFVAAMFYANFNLFRDCLASLSKQFNIDNKLAQLFSQLMTDVGYLGYVPAGENQLVVFTDNSLSNEEVADRIEEYYKNVKRPITVCRSQPDREGIIKI